MITGIGVHDQLDYAFKITGIRSAECVAASHRDPGQMSAITLKSRENSPCLMGPDRRRSEPTASRDSVVLSACYLACYVSPCCAPKHKTPPSGNMTASEWSTANDSGGGKTSPFFLVHAEKVTKIS